MKRILHKTLGCWFCFIYDSTNVSIGEVVQDNPNYIYINDNFGSKENLPQK